MGGVSVSSSPDDVSARRSDSLCVLEGDDLRVEIDPSRGAKIVSLWHQGRQREWLLQSDGTKHPVPAYGSLFTEADLCGWDEMLPTADACVYPREPFLGVALPDHGEVWSQPWDVEEQTSRSITCSVRGRALPYRLQRALEVKGSTLSTRYTLSVDGDDPLSLLWAPHPQFAVEHGTRLTLPIEVEELYAAIDGSQAPMSKIPVPAYGIDCTRLVPEGNGMMLYPNPDARIAWARLTNADSTWLHMEWDTLNVPYFVIWMDNGRYANRPVICPEPMTGYFDDLQRASESNRVLVVDPSKPASWGLRLTFGRG